MKINITKKQYRELLEMSYAARWMVEAFAIDSSERFLESEQFLLSMAKDFGLKELVEEDGEQFYHSAEFLDQTKIQELIENYNNTLFWDELAVRLGQRDTLKKLSPERAALLTPEDLEESSAAAIERYATEFEEHQLSNIVLKND